MAVKKEQTKENLKDETVGRRSTVAGEIISESPKETEFVGEVISADSKHFPAVQLMYFDEDGLMRPVTKAPKDCTSTIEMKKWVLENAAKLIESGESSVCIIRIFWTGKLKSEVVYSFE